MSHKNWVRISYLAVLVLVIVTVFTLAACDPSATPGAASPAVTTATPEPSVEPTPEPTPPPPPTVSTMVVCGDIMSHSSNVEDAWDANGQVYDYTREIGNITPWVQKADYAVANLETTLSEGNYSGYPSFRTPDALAYNLKDMGFDLLLTANNHSLDAGFGGPEAKQGLYRTLDVLDQVGIPHVGTSRTEEEFNNNIVVGDVGGISVAFLGYTYGTNGIPTPSDKPWCINLFNKDYMTNLSDLDEDRLKADLEKAKALGTDMVAVMIHWGVEYQTKENDYQDRIADFLIANGADMVLGGHAHVLQPVELARTVTLPDGSQRTGFVAFSLGNLISGQLTKNTAHIDATAILNLTITKDNVAGTCAVTDWEYVPIYRTDRGYGYQGIRFELLDPHTVPDNGKAQAELEFIHKILGEDNDYALRAQNGTGAADPAA